MDKLLAKKTRLLARDFDKMFPMLAPLPVDFHWAGTFAETSDGLPFIGSVKERPFSQIWTGDDPILATLRTRPRPLKGRCGACVYKLVCGGNTRVRAQQLTGDPWSEDPGCYLCDEEIGLA